MTKQLTLEGTRIICEEERWNIEALHRLPVN